MNRGLPTNFKLKDGAFELKTGSSKADDNMLMFLNFFSWFRIFTQDFCVKIQSSYARSIASFNKYKGMFILDIKDTGSKYLEFTNIDSADFTKDLEKKTVGVSIKFSYNIPTTEESKTITFEKAI